LSLCVLLAVAIAHVNAGGYVLKGGVVDFGKPLDYFDQAVQAGESDFIFFCVSGNGSGAIFTKLT
jgi:hypothetical protein